jgi:hypothetical protein
MSLCALKQLDNGKWWCASCDPGQQRLLPVNARRTCGEPPSRARRRHPPGTGDHLHRLIRRVTGEDLRPGCGCEDWIRQLNEWGPDGCREHMEEIVDRMLAQADTLAQQASDGTLQGPPLSKRMRWANRFLRLLGGHAAARPFCRRMVTRAIRAAERDEFAAEDAKDAEESAELQGRQRDAATAIATRTPATRTGPPA